MPKLSFVPRLVAAASTLALSASLMLPAAHSVAGQTDSYTLPQQAYNQSRSRNYKVYVPTNVATPAPMVMALHGCKQTNDDVLTDWGMKAAADKYGFILVAPFITSYDGLRNENCWGFWFDHHRHEGAGEVEDLRQIALAVEANYSIDPNRRFITGLSSGGAMTAVAAVAHNEYWAAAAPAAGLPYGEDSASVSLSGQCPGSATFHPVSRVVSDMQAELNDSYPIPTMILQNKNDCTVLQQGAENIRDAHLQVFGTTPYTTTTDAEAGSAACAPYYQNNHSCIHTRYTQDGTMGTRSVVETVFLDGPLATPDTTDTDHGHYWVGGENGGNGRWSVRVGPSYPDIIWEFFSRHSRDGSQPSGQPAITLIGDNPMDVALNSAFTDPGATAEDAEDGSLTVTSDCSQVDTTTVGTYSCNYSATDSDGNTTAKDRAVIVYDPNASTATCEEVTAAPYYHVLFDRAYAGGTSNLRAFATGDNVDIGGSFDTWTLVTLYEGDPGLWYTVKPEACGGTGSGGTGGGSEPACQDWNDSNLNHDIANRAYYAAGYYTVGGNDYLGALSGTYAWVKETSEGVFEAGQCN
ncbi:PHB depolymerase family esterase [Marinobacter salinisoli]|uniref:PHB depolymerase family esterase n=1 Tax=Marinobacter salinisoli TaxID=2769486 RepID=A0ABX7MTR6_9GAMM|nr:PHB depolymerase family esterase [Marinobacter salinisoli]QSP94769.1 PHB depolymerase family esterase [Marinobacter salinisoli]